MINDHVKKTIEKIQQEQSATGLYVPEQTGAPVGLEDVLNAIQDLGEERSFIIKVILAVYVSTFLDEKDPLWLMLIGNPSSNKTTLVDLLKDCSDIYRLDTMTSNPFSSGQKEKEKPRDLLPLLHGKCFIIKEYATIFGRSEEMVKQLISDLVAIYDGEYSKHSPTRGTITYKSYFSHIGCITPMALNARQRYMNMVGARFLFLRIPQLTKAQQDVSLEKLWQRKSKKTKGEIAQIVMDFCHSMKFAVTKAENICFQDEVRRKLNMYALLISRARGIVIADLSSFQTEEGKEKQHYEVVDKQVEEPFRALKQLQKLALGLAIIHGHTQIEQVVIDILKMVVLSSMPVRRSDILKVFELKTEYTAREAATILGKNYKTVKRNLDELVALELLNSVKESNDLARRYFLREEFQGVFVANIV